ncbi:MAG: flagellar hook-associated protein FlgK [Clostridiaceae bacterium]|nr:flagellar hook-associated protein FlgK [Clostridiaceae bacterium]
MAGLFSTMNIGKSGMGVSQTQLNVTSHNLANTNTQGYTRQRANVVTSTPFSGATVGQVGTGAQVESIKRIRNSYYDYQFRSASSEANSANIMSENLAQIESIFNEPSKTGISNALSEFYASFAELSKNPSSSDTRTVVAQKTKTMTDLFNSTYIKLENLKNNTQATQKNYITSINKLLDKIDSVNAQIKSATSAGQTPNDLMDTRDNYLDELSTYFGISVKSTEAEGIEVAPSEIGGMVQGNLVSSRTGKSARLSFISSVEQDAANPNVTVIKYFKLGSGTDTNSLQTIRVSDLSDEQKKSLETDRIIWADSEGQATKGDGFPIADNELIGANELMLFQPSTGRIAGNIEVQKSTQKYMDQLDSLTMAIAFAVNAVHSGITDPLDNGTPQMDYMPFFVNKDAAQYDIHSNLTNIDVTLDAERKISAKNITINAEILTDPMKIKTRTNDYLFAYANQNNIDGEGDGSRALAISQLKDLTFRIQDFGTIINSRKDLFTSSKGGLTLNYDAMQISNDTAGMTLQSYYQSILDKLGVETKASQELLANKKSQLSTLENQIQQESGVSMDEELANLIQYQHSYNASAKIISTVDSLLDVVINGLMR